MAQYFTGTNGAFLVDGIQTAKITNWSLSANVSTLETTTLGDYAREYIAGIQSFRGSATLFYYLDANGNLDGKDLIEEVIRTTAPDSSPQHSVTLRVQETPARQVKLKIIVTSAQVTMAVGEICTVAIEFTGCEPLQDASLGS